MYIQKNTERNDNNTSDLTCLILRLYTLGSNINAVQSVYINIVKVLTNTSPENVITMRSVNHNDMCLLKLYFYYFFSGYQNHLHPDASKVFAAAAMEFINTLVPPGLYRR